MKIEIIQRHSPDGWVVHMDRLQVRFNSLEQARAFVDQLQARIDAPHPWPQPVVQGWRPDGRRTAVGGKR
ncbi:hypothetical protein ACSPX5_07605 [Pseudomonas sp. HLG18]|uniref:hypothetical protein n=1 Tax=Pseudomonas sp. HLG18 TaxID=3449277 RepID=UPI003F7494D6